MRGILFSVILTALFASCAGAPESRVLTPDESSSAAAMPSSYIITDHKTAASGGDLPEWVSRYYSGGVSELESMDAFPDRYVFISRNEGNNFNALNHWAEGFSTEQDFPRLAAARIEARFRAGVQLPDNEYGAFYETLIRAASDADWTGAVEEDNFWVRRLITAAENEPALSAGQTTADEAPPPPRENWEFLIMVSIGKNIFASQLDDIFRRMKPNPPPSRDQAAAAREIIEHFFEGF